MRNDGPSLIVMLTANDRTVGNAIEVFEESAGAGAEFWGFKEVGIPPAEMKDLVGRMRRAGKTSFLEVVEYDEASCLAGAKLGLDCGFDYIMGTIFFPSVAELLGKEGAKYMPFVGSIRDRPSVLEGTAAGMVEEAKRYIGEGVFGIDLLAYRYTGDADALAQQFVQSVPAPVCLAGSIASYERLDRVRRIKPWAFTVGSAFFAGKFGADLGFAGQIAKVVDYVRRG